MRHNSSARPPAHWQVTVLIQGSATRSSIVLARHGSEIALFDTGMAHHAVSLTTALSGVGLTPDDVTHVFNTHAHPDHSHNNVMFPRCRLVASARDRLWTRAVHDALTHTPRPTADDVGPFYPEIGAGTYHPRTVAKALAIGKLLWDETRLGDECMLNAIEDIPLPSGIVAIETPGHTPYHVSFLIETGTRPVVVCGDALPISNEDQVGAVVMPPWSPDRYRESRARLTALDAIIVPGHDQPFENHVSLAQNKMSNPPVK